MRIRVAVVDALISYAHTLSELVHPVEPRLESRVRKEFAGPGDGLGPGCRDHKNHGRQKEHESPSKD